jgi:hypothetical protein
MPLPLGVVLGETVLVHLTLDLVCLLPDPRLVKYRNG